MTGGVAWTIDNVQDLLGVGQRDDQRRVSPDAFVGYVHPFLVLAVRRRNGAINIHVGDRPDPNIGRACSVHVPALP